MVSAMRNGQQLCCVQRTEICNFVACLNSPLVKASERFAEIAESLERIGSKAGRNYEAFLILQRKMKENRKLLKAQNSGLCSLTEIYQQRHWKAAFATRVVFIT